MRRTLAIAVVAGLLFVGGCDRGRSAAPPAAPAPVSGPASGATATDDVDGLLDQVDQQLSNDSRPAEDED